VTGYGFDPIARGLAVPAVLELVGQAPKRGLIPRLPTGDALLDDVEAWLKGGGAPAIRSTTRRADTSGTAELVVALHPAAEPVVFTAGEAGLLRVRATTLATGPGYHTFVYRMLERLSEELGITWTPHDRDAGTLPAPTSALLAPLSGDRMEAERASLTWLRLQLVAAGDAVRLGLRGVHVGLPDGTRFTVDEALATPLGTRDDGWLERALREPRVAIDILPWWVDALGARHYLDRALTLMWTEVRWRPAAAPSERAIQDETLTALSHAFRLDPSIAFPWREWIELLDLRGIDDAPSHDIRERGAGLAGSDRRPLVGYRRHPVTIIHEGWALEVPGSFSEQRTDEEWSGGDGGRTITIAGTRTEGDDGRPLSADRFLAKVAGDLGPDALEHRSGEIAGRARLSEDGTSGVSLGVLDGFLATTGRGAAIRVVFDDPADWQWALDMWRSLRPT
jgi:hypothetical protein